MSNSAGAMALDASTRMLGWAVDVHRPVPEYGLFTLPGIKDRGVLYGRVVDTMEELIRRYSPSRFVLAPSLFNKQQTAARALGGVQAMIEFVAANCEIPVYEALENLARKAVLGRINFGARDASGKIIPGSGRKEAKSVVMAWADQMGYRPTSDDVADALVLLHYDRIIHAPVKRRGDSIT